MVWDDLYSKHDHYLVVSSVLFIYMQWMCWWLSRTKVDLLTAGCLPTLPQLWCLSPPVQSGCQHHPIHSHCYLALIDGFYLHNRQSPEAATIAYLAGDHTSHWVSSSESRIEFCLSFVFSYVFLSHNRIFKFNIKGLLSHMLISNSKICYNLKILLWFKKSVMQEIWKFCLENPLMN